MAATLCGRSRALGYCWPSVVLSFALLAALLMPVALNKLAARGIGKLASPVQQRLALSNSSKSRALNVTASTSKANNGSGYSSSRSSKISSGTSPTAVRSVSGKANMSSQQFKYRDPIVFNARDKHTGTVIMLHGLGDSGDGWAPIGAEWAPELRHVKFVFPHAPRRPISVNFGMQMPGWYDIASLEDIDQKEDKDGLHESKRYIEELIEKEVAGGVPSERVVVAGFSQGGAVALMALRSQHKLAGVIGLSTYLPLRKEPPLVSDANMQTPIFQAHGDQDYTVGYQFGVTTYNLLKELGANITFKTYNGMAHGVSCFAVPLAVL
eukprot:GHRQ01008026.1.p1 GENE.GHRQ01008026.1~~GHRQ01008026.1.p1  ORF type:complete len:324 (+),score=76.17 GHRQ01008026.1:399-1370(+)